LVADFLDAKVKEIDDRLKELRPLVEEFHRLEAARGALAGVTDTPAASPPRRGPGRPRGSRSGSGNGRRRGRPRSGADTRATQALELVRARPGISIRDLAEAMDIQPNYLYRILPTLEKEGQVERDGKGWRMAQGGATAAEPDAD
jgi:predicted Rossmann fold nucleotide-binding protein DprA/Smf involved in DNA uptake